jgi:hypothetical protein
MTTMMIEDAIGELEGKKGMGEMGRIGAVVDSAVAEEGEDTFGERNRNVMRRRGHSDANKRDRC